MRSTLRPRPPLPPSLPTQVGLGEILDENAALLSAAHAFQKSGQVVEAIEYLRRSQVNIVATARFLRRQQEQERAESCGIPDAPEPVKAIALKKPPPKRRRKSEVEESQSASIVDPNKPLDMPSLS